MYTYLHFYLVSIYKYVVFAYMHVVFYNFKYMDNQIPCLALPPSWQ